MGSSGFNWGGPRLPPGSPPIFGTIWRQKFLTEGPQNSSSGTFGAIVQYFGEEKRKSAIFSQNIEKIGKLRRPIFYNSSAT